MNDTLAFISVFRSMLLDVSFVLIDPHLRLNVVVIASNYWIEMAKLRYQKNSLYEASVEYQVCFPLNKADIHFSSLHANFAASFNLFYQITKLDTWPSMHNKLNEKTSSWVLEK